MKTKGFEQKLQKLYDVMDNSRPLKSIRDGLVMLIPILLIGAFSVVLRSMPIPWYQHFLDTFLDGVIDKIFLFLYNATLGFIAVNLTVTISISYAKKVQTVQGFNYGPTITSLICFCIFSGVQQEGFTLSAFGAQGVFTAIVCALCASAAYCVLEKKMLHSFHLYADGADGEFNRAVVMVLPIIVVSMIFAVINVTFEKIFQVAGFQMLFANTINHIFDKMGRSLGTMILFLVLSNVMWFFGIHGNDVLEPVSQLLFVPAIEINQQLVASGAPATEIFSKTFYDVFVLMGGSGNTLSLFLALLLFSKRRNNKRLACYSALPMIFNVNEILVFGLPIVFNPLLLIPFVLTPIVLVLFSTFVMQIGLVPIPITPVEWTTPVLLGGYIATGSVSGAVLQLVNIIIGVLIYRPFVKMYDGEKNRDALGRLDKLIHIFKQSEEADQPIEVLALANVEGEVAKSIAGELRYSLHKQLPRLFYQPQYDKDGRCVGAEALMRWTHPVYGFIYPPLVVKLAAECGILLPMEEAVFRSVIKDMAAFKDKLDETMKISVNVTGTTIQMEEFELFLERLYKEYPEYCSHICIEITEQAVLKIDEVLIQRLTRIHNMGYGLAIDDFSMGSTSIKYLQSNVFDLLKLDGGLSRDVLENPRSREIVSSIVGLAKNLEIQILAEFVETEEQREVLEEIGCYQYQGYLYSPAVPLDLFLERCIGQKADKDKRKNRIRGEKHA